MSTQEGKSFAEQLKNTPPKKREEQKKKIPDEEYIKHVINAIKTQCEYKNNEGIHHVKGYLNKTYDTDGEYYAYYMCEIRDSLPQKKDIIARSKSDCIPHFTAKYYPNDPEHDGNHSGWGGFLFPDDSTLIKKIKAEFDELGFKNSNINFTRIEIEKTKKFLGMISFEKTGIFGYIIDVDINW